MKYNVPRGTKDILPQEVGVWQKLEETCRKVFSLYNYYEIRTPIFESADLFIRSVGTNTDIVQKEMYEFQDKKGRDLVLRPEETAPVVRAGLENNLISPDKVTKLYYIGPMFRYERPQAGRQRQFHQAGVEVFGSSDPMLDVEVIQLNLQLLAEMGLKDLELNLNSVGCKTCRQDYLKTLKHYFKDNLSDLCEDCQTRYEHNALRILDCKQSNCQKLIEGAPAIIESLCPECSDHFKQVNLLLNEAGIAFKTNKRLVRGLDYYTKTTFEIVSNALGSQNAVSGGGRYDNLVEEFGGKPTPAIGFAVGLERVIEIMTNAELRMTNEGRIILFVASLGDEARKISFDLVKQARTKGLAADMDYSSRSLKSQLGLADKMLASYVYIVGEEEIKKGCGILRNMQSHDQKEIKFEKVLEEIA